MMLDHLTLAETIATALAAILGLLALVWGWATRIKPKIRRVADVWDGLVELLFGRPEEPENPITGAPAVPPVLGIGPRLATTEVVLGQQREELSVLTKAVAKLVDNEHRLTALEHRVTVLEDARVEQVVAKAESAAMWQVIAHEQQDTHTDPPADYSTVEHKEIEEHDQ